VPLASIPFKSPPPFELPPMMAQPLRTSPRQAAAEAALELLGQLDAGEAMAVAFVSDEGHPVLSAVRGSTTAAEKALDAWRAEASGPPSANDLVGKTLLEGQPLLFMGEAQADDASPLPASLKAHLLAGATQAPIGFLYTYPLPGPDHKPLGALIIHRPLAAGPLNHDQPAIAQAVAILLGEAASA